VVAPQVEKCLPQPPQRDDGSWIEAIGLPEVLQCGIPPSEGLFAQSNPREGFRVARLEALPLRLLLQRLAEVSDNEIVMEPESHVSGGVLGGERYGLLRSQPGALGQLGRGRAVEVQR